MTGGEGHHHGEGGETRTGEDSQPGYQLVRSINTQPQLNNNNNNNSNNNNNNNDNNNNNNNNKTTTTT